MYPSDDTISASFGRLLSADADGKKGMERTSALMYFLAYDAMVSLGQGSKLGLVDMNPNAPKGLLRRNQFVAQYMNLVVLGTSPPAQIAELGKVAIGGRTPAKRASANFLTTPLKRASQSVIPLDYPRRPAPLLRLGVVEGGARWGVQRHPDWVTSLPSFLLGTGSKTPFTDLAIVVVRAHDFGDVSRVDHVQLKVALSARFSVELVDLWSKHMRFEAKKADCPTVTLQNELSTALCDDALKAGAADAESGGAIESTYVTYLEALLKQHGIPFKQGKR